ncbi:MAG: MnhB domain-containing protein [Gammaproteobacteria bacterium]|nr:MnhB domain-containing protein [Gammaproteobacteria bacterium]
MRNIATLLFLGGLAFLLIVITGSLDFGAPPMRIGTQIQAATAGDVGTANIVTAVVLGYRGLDTLGELSILFAAATAGGLVLGSAAARARPDGGFILRAGADLMFPLLLIAGLYIVIHGHLTPGGGFQGGVILAAAFFLPLLARPGTTPGHRWLMWIEGLSGATFIVIGLLALYRGDAFLTPLFDHGTLGELVSGGSLPLLYLAVGLKVGAELAGLLMRLAQDDEVTS